MVRRRNVNQNQQSAAAHLPSSPSSSHQAGSDMPSIGSWSVRSQWIFFAVASGACAAFNGVFAKLTTTELTTSLSKSIAGAIGLSSHESIVEVVVRAIFFGLNLTFNGIMWTLFTTALARGTSTTQVSIMNTSTNFVLTALLGLFIFSEALPPVWWAGAAMLVAGNVIVGRKDESKDTAAAEAGYTPVVDQDILDSRDSGSKDDEDEDIIDLGELSEGRAP
ncbi:hypothetical protein S40285_08430 [Stachybotrys chlorohalonatus IBT 40285]|uniref:EamA domain-containing protein n=1 Tax=Stachybotrys chlorohalonatus (strain IBT 40285) TaxID=1283841 RepID=A0A084QGJ2_STAC4|nr:hypothetical protein S40285_08430 [Stachybotrys chlorohalonata IBT 40285]